MSSSLTFQGIESTIIDLPIQNRTMMHLLLLQYMDVPQEEIEYMATDQPDARFLAGEQPHKKIYSLEAIQNVADRAGQYRSNLRQKRERPGLQIHCLQNLLAFTDLSITIAERLLVSRFEVDQAKIDEQRQRAPIILLKQERRKLERGWDQKTITESEYQKERMVLEYQALLRRRDQQRRRLIVAKREFHSASNAPLLDHEIAHIWGIPLGSLVARKVKALTQYLTGVQKKVQEGTNQAASSTPQNTIPTMDYWKETFALLCRRPIERSVVMYSGLERNEETLMEKLQALALGRLSEEEESKFWQTMTKIHDSEHSGMWQSHDRSIFALQRLSAIQKEFELSDELIEEELLSRVAPKSQEPLVAPSSEQDQPIELSEQGAGVLQAFMGEQDDKRRN